MRIGNQNLFKIQWKIGEMQVLITGAAGFIGSHLAERYVKNCEVIGLDNYFTGSTDNHIPGVQYIKGSTKNISILCTDLNPDIIFHLGEYSRVEQSFSDIQKVLEFNLEGTKSVLEYVRNKKSKLIYAGSSTKYSDIGKNASPYAWSKAINTELVKNYGEWFGINYAITYFYNVYGPREIERGKYSTLIALFNKRIKENKVLKVVSPGTQKRNFTHILDTIDALELIAEKGCGDEFGIGSDEAFSVLEIADMFKGKIEMIPPRKGNRLTAKVITDRTKYLGWTPKRSIQEYILNDLGIK